MIFSTSGQKNIKRSDIWVFIFVHPSQQHLHEFQGDVQINVYFIFSLLLVMFGLNQRKTALLDTQCASWALC